jgi:3-oxoacyl-[acyl-carrier-protein] synthase II
MSKRVVVTGMGVITPIGNNIKTFWDNLVNGVSGIDAIKSFDVENSPVKIGGEVTDFDPLTYFTPKEAKRMDRCTMFGIAAAKEAIETSGLLNSEVNPERVGVIVGSGIGGIQTLEEQHKIMLDKGSRFVSPLFIPTMISDIISGQIAIRWGFLGPNYSVSSACATGTHAIGISYRHILSGDANVMVCGGTEAGITPLSLAGFSNMKALSTRNDEPEKASRPFDLKRDGFVVSEGAGVVILEELQHALKRDAEIYGEIIGYGFSADAYHITAPHPEGKGAALAIKRAIEMSKLHIEKFGYINAHGTSTPLNDKFENKAIKTVFGDYTYNLNISSNKSMIGHLLGAAGSVEFISLLLTLKNQIIPPTINYEFPDPECDLNYTPNEAIEKELFAGLSNNFGFGGHNAVLAAKIFEL